MTISKILILSSKYEQLIAKDYRWDTDADVLAIIKRKIAKEGATKPPPLFEEQGLIFHTLSREGVIFVAVTRKDESETATAGLVFSTFEVLARVAQICKDFCGSLGDEAIELNVPLILELLDEIINYGYPQNTSTHRIQPYVQSNPVLPRVERDIFDLAAPALFGVDSRTVPNTAAEKPLIKATASQSCRNDVFVNVIETLSAVLKPDGSVVRCAVNGKLSMKCFLTGTPEIKLGLNSDLVADAGHDRGHVDSYNPQLRLTKCVFHKSLNMQSFPANRTVKFAPTDGEIDLVQYQVKGDVTSRLPFKLYTTVTDSPQHKCVNLSATIYCEIPNSGHAVNLQVTVPVPRVTTSVHCGPVTPGENAEFRQSSNEISWVVNKIDSKSEVTRKFKIYMDACDVTRAKDALKVLNLSFEIPDHVISPLRIKFLHIFTRDNSFVPHRWIRYVTYSESYTQRLV